MEARVLTRSRLKVLRTYDPHSAFQTSTAAEILAMYGAPRRLLSTSSKAQKSARVNVLNRVLYMPSGIFCPGASEGCLRTCLGFTSGRMRMSSTARARDRRAALYLEDQEQFLSILKADLYWLQTEAFRSAMIPAVRLNGTSDIPYERLHPEIFEEFPGIWFLDYTKLLPRMWHFVNRETSDSKWPPNYHLTFSISESNKSNALPLLQAGGNVAVVFKNKLPKTYGGYYSVIDGDEHDARFLDPKGVIVGLSAKGAAQTDQSGFVHTAA